jgi:hypothetical protein
LLIVHSRSKLTSGTHWKETGRKSGIRMARLMEWSRISPTLTTMPLLQIHMYLSLLPSQNISANLSRHSDMAKLYLIFGSALSLWSMIGPMIPLCVKTSSH